MPLIDTLTLKTDLLDGGMPEPQAAAIVKALADADVGQLATKADLESLRADVRTEIEALRAEMNAKIEALRSDLNMKIKALRGDNKLLRWMGGVILAFQVLVLGKLFFT